MKESDKWSGVDVWDGEDYLAQAKKQLDDKDVYQELRGDVEDPLEKINKVIRKLRKRGDISNETLDYFSVNNSKLGRFYLLSKIHKSFMMCLGDLLFQTRDFTQKTFFPLSSIILSHLSKTLSRTLEIRIISNLGWLAFLLSQMMLYCVP